MGMSATEYQSEFRLWAEMAAPLIEGSTASHLPTPGLCPLRAGSHHTERP
jgi:hypothetical protein